MDASSDSLEPVELLADEFMDRQRRGERPTIDEYVKRHPELADEIRDVFPALVMMEQVAPDSVDLSQSETSQDSAGAARLEQIGDYRIIREIGRGGMGVVYEAEQESLRRRVALKVLPRQSAGNDKAVMRFQREARAAARMHHTNIVPVFDVGDNEEHLFYAMQLIRGQGLDLVVADLKQLRANSINDAVKEASEDPTAQRNKPGIAASLMTGRFAAQNLAEGAVLDATSDHAPRKGPQSDAEALRIYAETIEHAGPSTSAVLPGKSELSTVESDRAGYFRSVAEIGLQTAHALSYAHSRGIIHRDIKPSNLLLDAAGVVWITDFGLAKTGDEAMTHTGDILGTIRYMSPERFRGECDVRADIYALGLTLYELLALRPAFSSSDRLKLIELVTKSEPEQPRALDPRIPRDLETIVLKAIEKDARLRYQSADELADDLQRFVNDEPIKARRISLPERFFRWSRRNKAIAFMTVAIATLLFAFSVTSIVVAGRYRLLAGRETKARQKEADARRSESAARAEALLAKEVAEEQREAAVVARREAEAARYVADMNYARTLWEAGNMDRLRDLLLQHAPSPGEDRQDLRNFEWYYWWRAAHLNVADFYVTGGSSYYMAVSPDRRLVCVVHWNNAATILNRVTRERVAGFPIVAGSQSHHHTPAFSPDGKVLYFPGSHGVIGRYDTSNWQRLPDLGRGLGEITALAGAPVEPKLAIRSGDSIRILDAETGSTLLRFPFEGEFRTMAYSPDGDTLAVGFQSKMARITGLLDDADEPAWRSVPDIAAWKTVLPSFDGVADVAYSRDGAQLVTCGYDGVRRWNPNTFEPVDFFPAPSSVKAVAISPNGLRLAGAASENNSIYLWSIDQPNQQPMVIQGHNKPVFDVAFPDADDELWSSGNDGKVKLWNLNACRPLDSVFVDSEPLQTGVAFHPNGRHLLRVDGSTGRAFAHDVSDLAQSQPLPFSANVGDVNGDWAALWTASDQMLRVMNLATDETIGAWKADTIVGGNLSISRDGSTVVWAQSRMSKQAPRLHILRPHTGSPPTVIDQPDWGTVGYVDVSPDGARCTILEDWNTHLWALDRPDLGVVKKLPSYGPEFESTFSPDGRLLAVGDWYNWVRIHDAKTGELLRVLEGHSGAVFCVEFSPDGTILASGGEDGTVKLWDPYRGALRTTLPGRSGPVYGLAFSLDGTAIASRGEDHQLRIWRSMHAGEDGLPNGGEYLRNKANGRLRLLLHDDALKTYRQALTLLPERSFDRHEAAFHLAFLLVNADRMEEYRKLCRQTALEFEQSDNIQIMERTLKMCMFTDVAQHENVYRVIDRFLAKTNDQLSRNAANTFNGLRRHIELATGIASYRRGDHAAAARWLSSSREHFDGPEFRTIALYYEALAAHRANRPDLVHDTLCAAGAETRNFSGSPQQSIANDWVVLQSVRREAEATIPGAARLVQGGNFKARGNSLLNSLDYFGAMIIFQKAIELLPKGYDHHETNYRLAFLLVHLDKLDEYKKLCQDVAAQYSDTTNLQIMERTLKMATFADVAHHDDVTRACQRFLKVLARNSEDESLAGIKSWVYQALGIAAYRLGALADAADWLQKSNAGFGAPDGGSRTYTTTNQFFLALAAHKAQNTAAARKYFQEAESAYAALPLDSQKTTSTDWIVLQEAKRQAEAVMKVE